MSILRMTVMVGVVTLLARTAVGVGSADQSSVRPARIDVPGKAGLVYYPSDIVSNPDSYQDYFEWIKQFRFCLGRTPVYFRAQYRVALQQAGCLLLVRMPFGRINQPELALHAKDPTRRRRYDTYREICSHPEWLLNPDNPIARREEGPPSYFFDFGNAELRKCFARFIRKQVEETQYDGVFFDIMGGYGVPAAVQAMWNKKHPDLQYDKAAGQFVRELHELLGNKLVGGNQAYKAWKCYFPHVD